jgi:hypothetical protein
VKQQTENNSIVIFSPRWDTMHAIRAHYDHLVTQRTQFYGNLWYETSDVPPYGKGPEFEDFDFVTRPFSPVSRRLSKYAFQMGGAVSKLGRAQTAVAKSVERRPRRSKTHNAATSR